MIDSRKEETAASDVIVHETLCRLFIAEILDWVGPKDIAHEARGRRFSEPVDLRGRNASAFCLMD